MVEGTVFFNWRNWLASITLLTVLWALFFWRVLTPVAADHTLFAKGDFTVQFFSNSDYQVEQINRGHIPLWNPYNYGGEPFAANLQLAAWYPPRWIAAVLLGSDNGWSVGSFQIEVAVHYWIASILTFAFVKLWSKRWITALAAALMFTYGGFLTGYPMLQVSILECAVWLPLMLIGAHLSATKPGWRLRGVFLMSFAIGLSFLAGHPQTTVQAAYLAVAYLAFTGYRNSLSWWGIIWRIGLAVSLSIGLAMIQLLPSAEFTLLSYRLDEYGYIGKSSGFTLSLMGNIIWPALDGEWAPLYLSTPGILLAASALLRPKASTVFWGAAGILALGIAMGRHTIVYDLFYILLPGISLFRLQEHIALVASFALVMVAAHQLDWLLDASPTRRRRLLWLLGGFMAWHSAMFIVSQGQETSFASTDTLLFVLIMTGLFTYWTLHLDHHTWVPRLIIALLVFDLFTVTGHSNNFAEDIPENQLQAPQTLDTLQLRPAEVVTWRVDGAAAMRANNIFWRVPDIYGIGPIFLRSTEELRQLPVDLRWEIFAVRYITVTEEPPERADLELIAYDQNDNGENFRLFEVINPRPFAHLVYDYRVTLDNDEFARQMMADPRVDLREMAITTTLLPFDLPGERPTLSTVEDLEFSRPEHLQMTVSTGANALLTIAIPNYPGWEAEVNGVSIPIIDTYAGMIGIPLETGENQTVVLRFEPESQIWGALFTLVTLVGINGIALIEWNRQRTHQNQVTTDQGQKHATKQIA